MQRFLMAERSDRFVVGKVHMIATLPQIKRYASWTLRRPLSDFVICEW